MKQKPGSIILAAFLLSLWALCAARPADGPPSRANQDDPIIAGADDAIAGVISGRKDCSETDGADEPGPGDSDPIKSIGVLSSPESSPEPASERTDWIPLPDQARVLSVRYWSNKDYTRVVIELDREVPYEAPHLLKPDSELGTSHRLYIDFKGASIDQSMRKEVTPEAGCFTLPIGDGLLKKARAGQYLPDVSRVVLDIERLDHFKAFPLPGSPFRYVIDVYGEAEPMNLAKLLERGAKIPEVPKAADHPASPLKGASGKYIIVLDPGHGGKDPGAVGPSGLKEKDVVLAIAKRTKTSIESRRPDVKVVLTRSDDRFISLVERTAMANTMNADLFISIHSNAAKNSQAMGVETYYLDNTTDRASLRLAAKENFIDEEKMIKSSDTTNLILADLITNSKVEDSVPLAESIQRELIRGLRRNWSDVPDKGVKKAPFWVLTGATMPCALVEVSFMSNRTEEKRLASSAYQSAAAEAISSGVVGYLESYPLLTRAD